jgi:hypothetical protein
MMKGTVANSRFSYSELEVAFFSTKFCLPSKARRIH